MAKITFSNFTPLRTVHVEGGEKVGLCGIVAFAEVTMTVKRWFHDPVVTTEGVYRSGLQSYWRFTSTGKFTPGSQVEDLADAHAAAFLYAKARQVEPTKA